MIGVWRVVLHILTIWRWVGMIERIHKLWNAVSDWLPVLTGLVVLAEAEGEGAGAGAEKKAKVLKRIEENLGEQYPWISEEWAKSVLGYIVNLIVWALNKWGKGLMDNLAKFVPNG